MALENDLTYGGFLASDEDGLEYDFIQDESDFAREDGLEDYYRQQEEEVIREILSGSAIDEKMIPIFESFSNGKGRPKRKAPVQVILVLARERIERVKDKTVVIRKYKTHKDGDDMLDALVRESLGPMADLFSEKDSMDWVEWLNKARRKSRRS